MHRPALGPAFDHEHRVGEARLYSIPLDEVKSLRLRTWPVLADQRTAFLDDPMGHSDAGGWGDGEAVGKDRPGAALRFECSGMRRRIDAPRET